ncbi:scavenger receptor class B member 1 [Anoplolepis gracilipes]|uniref:scavenger receptor class B member 1 n=1 Tax=Anoplolepis gracilipes TaxID=354296 RepID=UPI003B9EA2F6
MKSIIALQQFKKCIILFTVGIICSVLTYVIYVVQPASMLLEYNLQMTPNSILFLMWKRPPLDIYLNVYVFNITNSVEFLSGKEKLKIQEIGPYVYQEFLENDNITFNDNDTLTYIPRRSIKYVPEMSVGDPTKDMVNVPNIPFLGASSALHDSGFLVNYPLVQLTNMFSTKPILNISVYDYLWGYEDSIVALASGIVPNFINFRKLGLLDRMYDEGENIVTINLRKNTNMTDEKGRYLSIEKYNGSPGLAHWGYVETEGNETREENSICNTIQGASEGIIFPPYIDKRAIFRVFRKAFCRTLPVEFKEEIFTESGLSGYLYALTEDFAYPPDQNPDNECYCRKMKTCMKKGLSNITPCYYNIPTAISLPHFLDADPSLLEDIEGLKPDRKKHESFAIIQETIGIPIYVHSRMQTNLIMHPTHYNSKITVFNGLTLPLIWSDMYIPSLSSEIQILLKIILNILPVIQTVLIYLLGIIGIITIMLSLTFTLRILNKKKQEQEQEAIKSLDNPDLRIPLCNGQYTSINILPVIKKITSKSDLFTVEPPYS